MISAGIILPTLLNLLSAAIVSRTETYVVAIKLAILILVIVAGFKSIAPTHLAKSTWPALPQIAAAAKPSLGQFGFMLVAVSAVLATFSAINATLYGSARLSYTIATEGELPVRLQKKAWGQPVGLLITAVLALLLANFFDLSAISTMGSAGFLIIFAIVNAANFVKAKEIGSLKWIAGLGVAACLFALGVLVIYTFRTTPSQVMVLVGMVAAAFAIEGAYLRFWKKSEQEQRIAGCRSDSRKIPRKTSE